MTREQELKLMAEYIKNNGVTKLPDDARIEFNSNMSVWRRSKKVTKKKKKIKKKA
jgi:hypothetical protein